ncbi:MAG TPA: RHS repeat-associated core domain-containing protein, partial [Polyangiaceae bacterium LLY-WYZ-15_(1-7)]|nr:RHS repeat-associated core domain-containing protein [Polyangiaceae bacterium LLY-WYZ-15_(1-7)]
MNRSFPVLLALLGLLACSDTPDSPGALQQAASGFPADAFDDVIVPTEGHAGPTPIFASVGDDGSARVTLPIAVPEGRAGMQPELTLQYSSRGQEGIAGMGWSLSGLSAIHRCNENLRLDGQMNADVMSRALCLDGRRLVPNGCGDPVSGRSEAQRCEGGSPLTDGHYRVWFNGTERVTLAEGKPDEPGSWFEVELPDGRVRTYGRADEATVVSVPIGLDGYLDPGLGEPIPIRWLLQSERDANGNTIEYHYRTVTDASFGAAEEVVLDSIAYTSHPTRPANRFVTFHYRQRQRPRQTYSSGARFTQSVLLEAIETEAPRVDGAVRRYELAYEDATTPGGMERLATATECDGEGVCREPIELEWREAEVSYGGLEHTGIGVATREVQRAQLSLLGPGAGGSFEYTTVWDCGTPLCGIEHRITRGADGTWGELRLDTPNGSNLSPFDFDSDGRAEVLGVIHDRGLSGERDDDRFQTAIFELDGASVGEVLLEISDWLENPALWYLAGDFDGNGASDVLYAGLEDPPELTDDDLRYECIPAGPFNPEEECFPPELPDRQAKVWARLRARGADPSWFTATTATLRTETFPYDGTYERYDGAEYVLDVDGDGRDELLAPLEAGDDAPLYIFDRYDGQNVRSWSGLRRDPRLLFMDFNGDGLSDAVYLGGPNVVEVRLNTGRGFLPADIAIEEPPLDPDEFSCPKRRHYEARRPKHARIADLNRDGFDDLVLIFEVGALDADDGRIDGLGLCDATPNHGGSVQVYLNDGQLLRHHRSFSGESLFGTVTREDGTVDFRFGMTQVMPWRPDGELALFSVVHGDPLQLRMRRIQAQDPDLLERVTRGGTELVRFEYDRLGSPTAHYTPREDRDTQRLDYPQRDEDVGVIVVNAHVDLLGRRYEHHYVDSRSDAQGQGWLGFARHLVHDVSGGTITERRFDVTTHVEGVGFPFANVPYRETVFTPLDDPKEPSAWHVSLQESVPDLRELDTDGESIPTRVVRVVRSTHRLFDDLQLPEMEGWSAEHLLKLGPHAFDHWFEGEEPYRFREVSFGYDELGRTDYMETVFPDAELTTVEISEFEVLADHYVLDLPKEVVTTSTAADGVGAYRHTVYEYDALGRLAVETMEPNRPEFYRETRYDYSEAGSVKDVIVVADGEETTELRIDYDEDDIHPRRMVNALGHTTWVGIHPAFSIPVIEIDPNGVESRTRIDGFGRVREQTEPTATHEVEYLAGGSGTTYTRTTVSDGTEVEQWYDRALRPTIARRRGFDGWIRSEQRYDALGRVQTRVAPHYEGEPSGNVTHYAYDGLGRVSRVTPPAGRAPTEIRYQGGETVVEEPTVDGVQGAIRHRYTDLAGRLVMVRTKRPEAGGRTQTLRYTYGPFAQMRRVLDEEHGDEWTVKHDAWGRVLRTTDPDVGTRHYAYDARARRIGELDDAGRFIERVADRDVLGRVRETWHREHGVQKFTYDEGEGAVGRLTGAFREASEIHQSFEFDALGRPRVETTQLADGRSHRVITEYDGDGRVSRLHFDGLRFDYRYHSRGQLDYIRDAETGELLWRANDYDAFDRVTQETLYPMGSSAAPIDRVRAFDAQTGVLERIRAYSGLDEFQDLEYEHDVLGRVERITDDVHDRVEEFDYDDLHRITDWFVDGTRQGHYEYDDRGNLVERFGKRQEYGEDGSPHHLTTIAGLIELEYDERGRRKHEGDRTFNYNEFDLPTSVLDGATLVARYEYDALGRRVVEETDAGETVHVAGGLLQIERPTSGPRLMRVRVPGAGGIVAEVATKVGATSLAHAQVSFRLTDAQGSTRGLVMPDHRVVGEAFYEPFGQPVDEAGRPVTGLGSMPEMLDNGYTDHEHDLATGLIHMRGRSYDPRTARFLSADPVIPGPTNREAWNPYSYVLNSPTNFTDPTGFWPDGDNGLWYTDDGNGNHTIEYLVAGVSIIAVKFFNGGSGESDRLLLSERHVPPPQRQTPTTSQTRGGRQWVLTRAQSVPSSRAPEASNWFDWESGLEWVAQHETELNLMLEFHFEFQETVGFGNYQAEAEATHTAFFDPEATGGERAAAAGGLFAAVILRGAGKVYGRAAPGAGRLARRLAPRAM